MQNKKKMKIYNFAIFFALPWWTLREKCPNTEFFPVRSFLYLYWIRSKSPYSVQIQENKDQKKLRIWALFTQWKYL